MASKDLIKNLIRINDSTYGSGRFRVCDKSKRKRLSQQEYALLKTEREKARKYMQQNFQGKSFKNTIPNVGDVDIYVFSEGINETLADKIIFTSSSWHTHLGATYQLDYIIENGTYIAPEKNRKPQTRKGFDWVHRFETSITLNGVVKKATIVVKENTSSNKKPYTFYANTVQDSNTVIQLEFVCMEIE